MIYEIDFQFQNEFVITTRSTPLPPYLCLASSNLFFPRNKNFNFKIGKGLLTLWPFHSLHLHLYKSGITSLFNHV